MSMNSSSLMRVLIVGPLGSGKSAFANVILKRDAFASKKSLSSKSVTSKIQHERVDDEEMIIEVCDTPAFEEMSGAMFNREIKSGYDVIAIIVPVKRITRSTEIAFRQLRKRFEDAASTHVILTLTFADELIESPSEFLTGSGNKDLDTLVKCVKTRMVVIDNTLPEERTDKRRMFINIAREMLAANKRKKYNAVPVSYSLCNTCRGHALGITIIIAAFIVVGIIGSVAYLARHLVKQKANSSDGGD